MHNIVICIPTYRRPFMLRKLILSIYENRVDTALINDLKILIIDNDVHRSAETIVESLNEINHRPNKLMYYNHPVKGLSNVRNEMLNKALLLNPDFMIFIDDDEYVTPEWLSELLNTILHNNADIVSGPVIADLEENVSKYISYFFRRESYPNNSQIYTLATGNLIIRRTSFQKYNVWFDTRFNSTGSEDSFFGIQLLKKGATIYWADNAIAYETIPVKRATLEWLVKRSYNGAVTFAYILKLEKRFYQLIKKTVVSVIYIIIGALACLFLLFPVRWKYWGILKISEGIGGLAGLFSILFNEYE